MLKLFRPRLMKTFEFNKLVLKIVEVFCAQQNLKSCSSILTKLRWMEPAHMLYVSTRKSLKFVLCARTKWSHVVHRYSCVTVGCRRGPRPPPALMKRPTCLLFLCISIHGSACYQSNMDSGTSFSRPPEATARTHVSL